LVINQQINIWFHSLPSFSLGCFGDWTQGTSPFLLFTFYLFCGPGDQPEGLTCARQAFYQWTTHLLLLIWFCFWGSMLLCSPGWAVLLPQLPRCWVIWILFFFLGTGVWI
jgi:hypothetical protein